MSKLELDQLLNNAWATKLESGEYASTECEYCHHEAAITEPTGIKVCEDCHNDCPHDDIECGNCQDCGEHISDFMDEDYGSDR